LFSLNAVHIWSNLFYRFNGDAYKAQTRELADNCNLEEARIRLENQLGGDLGPRLGWQMCAG